MIFRCIRTPEELPWIQVKHGEQGEALRLVLIFLLHMSKGNDLLRIFG